jgi:hypothetical protein
MRQFHRSDVCPRQHAVRTSTPAGGAHINEVGRTRIRRLSASSLEKPRQPVVPSPGNATGLFNPELAQRLLAIGQMPRTRDNCFGRIRLSFWPREKRFEVARVSVSGGSRRTPQRGEPEKSGSEKQQGSRLWDRCGEKTQTMWTPRGIVGPNDLIEVVDADREAGRCARRVDYCEDTPTQ